LRFCRWRFAQLDLIEQGAAVKGQPPAFEFPARVSTSDRVYSMHNAGLGGMHFETSLNFARKNPSTIVLSRWHTGCSPEDERVASQGELSHEGQHQQYPPP
jgi:hypothetical protein